ncbi:MAG TPA: glycosyltransferase family 2 protein, partial [Tepidisphaeraceae bacterium]|nr:glycosyltransferase family 2 protein [Tepidisphaeraceae bacterium]
KKLVDNNFTPPATVVIPAYNEDKVIARTIHGVLASNYPALHVLVVDDGSKDSTSSVVRELAQTDSRIRLISKVNGGKYTALNLGFAQAEDDYVVTIDADTIVTPETVRQLMLPFADPSVDAVCGNVQVGNVRNLLTIFQDVEYVTTQNYDRRAFESLNCITVVPGATGAWKRTKILAIGGYSGDTLTEDADLSISLLRHGGKIVYAPLARSVTETPENLRAWFKQRFRWRFGMLQCLWKHRRCLGHGLLGCVAFPNIVVQMMFELISPLCDLLLILSLVSGNYTGVARAYVLFLSLDLAAAIIAYVLDRRSPAGLIVVPIQRFVYRPILYLVTQRAAFAMIRGRRHAWNKLQRTASIRQTLMPIVKIPIPQSVVMSDGFTAHSGSSR